MLKSLLSLLLSKFYSKKENEAVGHQAMPGASTTTLLSNTTVTDWETVATGVAADDGYLVLDAKNSGNEGASLALSIGGVTRTSLLYPFIGAGGNAFAPIAKGDAWAIVGSSSENIRLRLFKTIGGGYQALKNALLQGGGLCLSHWYSSLQRNSYRTSGSGWLISQQFLFKALLNYLLLQMEKVTHSRCRTRGLSTSEVMEFGLPILEGSISSISDHLRMGIFRSGLTLKKVKNLPTQLGNQISSLLPIFEYTKSRGTIDQMFGGASC